MSIFTQWYMLTHDIFDNYPEDDEDDDWSYDPDHAAYVLLDENGNVISTDVVPYIEMDYDICGDMTFGHTLLYKLVDPDKIDTNQPEWYKNVFPYVNFGPQVAESSSEEASSTS